jgi:hypothetical protein
VPSHGTNRGSNPLRDANTNFSWFQYLSPTPRGVLSQTAIGVIAHLLRAGLINQRNTWITSFHDQRLVPISVRPRTSVCHTTTASRDRNRSGSHSSRNSVAISSAFQSTLIDTGTGASAPTSKRDHTRGCRLSLSIDHCLRVVVRRADMMMGQRGRVWSIVKTIYG